MVHVVLVEPAQPASTALIRGLESIPGVQLRRAGDASDGPAPAVVVVSLSSLDDAGVHVAAARRAHPRSVVLIAWPGGELATDPFRAATRTLERGDGAGRTDDPAAMAAIAVRRLSPIEGHILSLIADGMTNPEIARELNLAGQTVKNYVSALFTKLGVSRRTEAAVLYVRAGEYDPRGVTAAVDGRTSEVANLVRELQQSVDRIDRATARIADRGAHARRGHDVAVSTVNRPSTSYQW